MTSRIVHLGLGSNQGDRAAHLRAAVRAIAAWPEVDTLDVSPVYETAHVGTEPAPPYLNVCVALHGGPAADEILRRAQHLERDAGRPDDGHMRPRPLDVDLLLDGAARRSDARLTLPHPRLRERRFVLQPLYDLDPSLTIPGESRSLAALLEREDVARQPIERVEIELGSGCEDDA